MKYCYVILHYKNILDTKKCIDSLQEIIGQDSELIVVDNGSNDGSGEELVKIYSNNNHCHILLLQKNLGFSKGNNEGYSFAKEKFNPDFIVITNNDVVFRQKNFESELERIFEETNYFVLGPDIYVPRHRDHQSPLFNKAITIPELEKEIETYKYYRNNPEKFGTRLKLHAFKNMMCSKFKMINTLYSNIKKRTVLDYRKRHIDVGLQGACIIFSKPFIEKEDKAFEPEPFLYEEEVFLFCKCQKKGYKTVYDPSISILHEEAASFSNLRKNRKEKLSFMLDHHVKAREMLLAYMKTEGNN